MTTIYERLHLIIKEKGLNPNSFATELKEKAPTIRNYLNGRPPRLETLAMIIEVFDDIDAEWLLTGKGNMYRTPEHTPFSGLKDSAIPYTRKNKTMTSLSTPPEIRKRIRELLETENLTIRELSEKTSLPAEDYTAQIEGEAPITLDLVENICIAVPATSPFWLLSGIKEKKQDPLLETFVKEIKKINKEVTTIRKEISELKNKPE